MTRSTDLKSLSYARKHWIPRADSGKPIAPSTIWRWYTKGIAGERLDVTMAGGTPTVSQADIEDFFDRVTAVRKARLEPVAVIDATPAELAAAGLVSS